MTEMGRVSKRIKAIVALSLARTLMQSLSALCMKKDTQFKKRNLNTLLPNSLL
jgi:hypothetical protein